VVDRVGKQNELTPFGALVLPRAQQIVMLTTELKRAAALMAEGVAGTVSLGMGSAPGALFSSPLMTHMLRNFPQVRLRLSSGAPEVQLAELRARHVDCLLMTYRAVPPAEDLKVEVLPALRSGFVARSGHPLGKLKQVRFKDVSAYALLSTKVSEDATRTLIERYGEKANPMTWLQASSDDVGSLIQTVLATDALFLGVLAVVRRQLDEGVLREIVFTPSARLQAQFAFITLRGRAESPVLEVIRSFCRTLTDDETAVQDLTAG
jgi:DNA-binding transcriptional LysR family regulator